jgi:hypothetical protein
MDSRSDVEVGGDCAFKSRLSSKFVMAYVSGLWRPEAAEGLRQTSSPPWTKYHHPCFCFGLVFAELEFQAVKIYGLSPRSLF